MTRVVLKGRRILTQNVSFSSLKNDLHLPAELFREKAVAFDMLCLKDHPFKTGAAEKGFVVDVVHVFGDDDLL